MELLSKTITKKEYDVRMLERNLSQGVIQREDLERYLKKLPDDSVNADFVNLDSVIEGLRGKSGLRG